MAQDFFKVRNGLSIASLSSSPASPQNGDMYYDSGLEKFQFYQDGAWTGLGSGGGSFPLLAPNGSATAPSYSFTNATESGIFLGSADDGSVSVAVNGSPTFTFNADGSATSASNIHVGGSVDVSDNVECDEVLASGAISSSGGNISTTGGDVSASGNVYGTQIFGATTDLNHPGLSFSGCTTLGFIGAGSNLSFVNGGYYYWYCGTDGVHYGGNGNTTNYNIIWDTDGGGSIGESGEYRPSNVYVKDGVFTGTLQLSSAGSSSSPSLLIGVGTAPTNTGFWANSGGIGLSVDGGYYWAAGSSIFELNTDINIVWATDGGGNIGSASPSDDNGRPGYIYAKNDIVAGNNLTATNQLNLPGVLSSEHSTAQINIGNSSDGSYGILTLWSQSSSDHSIAIQGPWGFSTTGILMSGSSVMYLYGGGGLCLTLNNPTTTVNNNLAVSGNASVDGQFSMPVSTVSTPSGTTQTINWNSGSTQELDLSSATGNVTVTFSNQTDGAQMTLFVVQGSSALNVTFTGVKWAGGAAPVISTGSGAIDIITFVVRGSTVYGAIGQNFS